MTSKKTPMTQSDASRIQRNESKNNNGQVGKDGFTSRAQRAAENNKSK
ncbi:hypothetical protein [Vibrio litoralis]|nr:hypothetical protein [Vibrio litoralis]